MQKFTAHQQTLNRSLFRVRSKVPTTNYQCSTIPIKPLKCRTRRSSVRSQRLMVCWTTIVAKVECIWFLFLEVLGNFRLRKLYDKGIIHTAGEKYQRYDPVDDDNSDEASKFYKARAHKDKSTATGRTPIYDFDAWTNSHYGNSFQQQQRLKTHKRDKAYKRQRDMETFSKELILMVTMLFMILAFFMQKEHHDVDRLKKRDDHKDWTWAYSWMYINCKAK